MFLAPWFALAGLIAAAGPLLIHLLSRQRQQVVEWGAMDFLREAVFRNRRIMQLRDLLLLALRTLCILAFGAAMARETVDLALEACNRVPEMAAKKIVLLTDRQVSNWPTQSLVDQLEKLPDPINVVQLKPSVVHNA